MQLQECVSSIKFGQNAKSVRENSEEAKMSTGRVLNPRQTLLSGCNPEDLCKLL